ncbi:MAG: BatA and WFA domain-containing protein [Clostridiales bacterium]|nr:BatA and WFA domain-containing protein [Clostridiales bacterium]
MKLAVPLGLLGLIAVAVLILIYIFKPKYQDRKFSSTYIWKLSLKYAKRKVPLQWLQNSLLFLIQLLILAIIAFSMAAPQVVLADKSGEKIIILDASASMTAVVDGKSRFDRAKNEISEIIDDTTKSHKISIILAGEEAAYLIRRSDKASYAKQKLFEAECGMTNSDVAGAMKRAQDVLAENPAADVYYFTDSDYKDRGKVKVVNMSASEWNAAILDFSAKLDRDIGGYVFTAEVASYGRAADIPVGLTIDGKVQLPKLASCTKNGTVSVVWDGLNVSSYGSAEVHLTANDSADYDNDFYIYAPNVELFAVQLVSDNPGFLNSALRATGKCRVVIPSETTPEETSGFDLYIYDGYSPEVMPTDGAVWFINPQPDIPSSTGISVGLAQGNGTTDRLVLSSASSSQIARDVLKSVNPSSITVSQYSRITRYTGFETIMSVRDDPVLLVKDDNGVKTVVLAFDIHMANFPILADFPLLINNLCKISMSKTVEKTLFEVGDEITISSKADAVSLTVKAKYSDGSEESTTYTQFPVRYTASRAGLYEVSQQTLSGRNANASFYVRISRDESMFFQKLAVLENPIIPYGAGTDTSIQFNTEDITIYFIIALLVLLCVEWGLQYREQY